MVTSYLSQQPVDDFGLRFADLKYNATLVASTDSPLTIPGKAQRYKAVIKSSGEVWMALNAVAQLPSAGFASKNSEMVNAGYVVCREVIPGDVIHFISSSTPNVGVVLYALNTNT